MDSITFQSVFRAKNAWPGHQYGATITLQHSEDKYLSPLGLIKKYIVGTKERNNVVISPRSPLKWD